MKNIKRVFSILLTLTMVFSMISCISIVAFAESNINWSISFAKLDGEEFKTINAVEPGDEFYIAIGIKDYSLIGEMVEAYDEDDVLDYTASAYNNVISCATIIFDCDQNAEIDASDIVSPYETATFETNFKDNQLRVIMWADKSSGGLDYSIGKAELDANDGVLFYVKAVAGEEGTLSYNVNTGTSSAATSIALINKAADVTFNALTHVSSASMSGYDTTYNLDVITEGEVTDPGYLETLAIPGFNVKFESDYSVYVYVPKTITNQYATVKVIASKAMYDGDTFTGYSDVELTEGISQGNYMLYEYAGFAAKEIASEIKAHIVAIDADGNEFYGPEKNYSLQSYALNKIKSESTDAKFRTMMVDFVNYGAAAQVYFSYNTTALANVGAEDYQNLATPTRAYEKHTANTADTSYATQIKGFNLQFLNKVHIYGYVAINGQDIEDIKANWYGEATYVDADGKSQTQRIDLSEMFASGSYYLFSFNNLFSKEMSVPVTFTLYNAEGEQMSNAATYSIESYANSKGSGTDNLAKLTQALMSFGDAASAYFKK